MENNIVLSTQEQMLLDKNTGTYPALYKIENEMKERKQHT